jgi:hypothetical protein
MIETCLYQYLENHRYINDEVLDLLKNELDKKIYLYGDQLKASLEAPKRIRKYFVAPLKGIYLLVDLIINCSSGSNGGKRILSNAYFTYNDELRNLGYHVYRPTWSVVWKKNHLFDFRFFWQAENLKKKFRDGEFRYLLSDEFIDIVNKFNKYFKNMVLRTNLKALCVHNDLEFFEKLAISVFQKTCRPSFLFLHGLPCRYNNLDDNRTTYMVLWGEQIKKNYIQAGVDESKIFISGHPFYKDLPRKDLKFSFDDVLVITKNIPGSPLISKNTIIAEIGFGIQAMHSGNV